MPWSVPTILTARSRPAHAATLWRLASKLAEKLLGYANISETMDTYSHILHDTQGSEAGRLQWLAMAFTHMASLFAMPRRRSLSSQAGVIRAIAYAAR